MARSGQWSAVALAALALGCGGGGGGGGGGDCTGGDNVVCGKVTYDFVPSVYDPGTGTGTLQFTRSAQRPVRGGVIQVVQGTAPGTTLGQAVTGEDGQFTVSFTPSGGALTLFALARTAQPAIQVQDNTSAGFPTWAISTELTGANQSVTLRATHGWGGSTFNAATRLAAPFAILDSMLTATRAFVAAKPGLTFPALKCNWSPKNTSSQAINLTTGEIGTSHYSSADNQLYILGKDQVDTDEFDSHVIVHEWGHFFEANLSRSDSPGGQHRSGDLLDPRLAFGEAWGNAVASMVLPESIYSDTSWTGAGVLAGFGFDLETEPPDGMGGVLDDPNPGPFSEFSVMRFLYDVFDSGAGESFDRVALGLAPIVEVMTGPERTTPSLTTLASFVAGVKGTAAGGAAAAALDTLAAHYTVGPITSAFGDGDPRLKAMFEPATPLPYTSSVSLGGGAPDNFWQQNQYFVFTGTGGTLTITSASAQDVDLFAIQAGVVKASATGPTGNEHFTLPTTSGATYVLLLTGYGPATAGDYPVTVSIQ